MPSREAILFGLQRLATDLWPVAVAWHVLLAAALVAVGFGWRPSERKAGTLLALLPASVAIAAAVSENPFNAIAFVALTAALLGVASRRALRPVHLGPVWVVPAGALLVAIGWAYPHFLQTDHPALVLIAAPLGLLPCPTLFVLLGATLLTGGLSSQAWSAIVALAAAVYGAIGAFALGVTLDGLLLVGAFLVVVASLSTPRSLAVSRTARGRA